MTFVRLDRSFAGRWVLPLAVMVGAGACASGSGGGGGGSADVITQAQLAETLGSNAFDAIQRYKSRWLRPARNQNTLGGRLTVGDRIPGGDQDVLPGQELYPRVYMDGSYFGDIDSLTQIQVDALESIEYMDARDATTRYGTGNSAGIIELHTRALADRR